MYAITRRLSMITFPEQIRQIKQLHNYNKFHKTSSWGKGLSKGKMVNGCRLDKLRNNISNKNWLWLYDTICNNVKLDTIPLDRLEQFASRWIELEQFFGTHILDDGEFSDWLQSNRGQLCQEFKAKLWKFLVSACECLEYLPTQDPHEEILEDVEEHPLFVF